MNREPCPAQSPKPKAQSPKPKAHPSPSARGPADADGLPPASGQQEAHSGDCHHGVDLDHEGHADCLSCSSRTVAQASNHDDEIVLSTLRPDTLAVPAEVPPTAVLHGGILGARGPPAIAG